MRDLARSLRLAGAPVAVPWDGLARLIRPRAQNLMVVMGAPGVGKSLFALAWAKALPEPSLYVSLDTSLFDQSVRLAASVTGYTVDEIAEGYDTDQEAWVARWNPFVEGLDFPIRFLDRTVGAKTIGEVIAAETEFWGSPPPLTIIDNAGNLLEDEESAQEYRRVFAELHRVARERHTLVVALHHLRKKPPASSRPCKNCGYGRSDDDTSTEPVHMQDGLYGGDQETQFVLGLWRPEPTRLRVGVLKNRMGLAAPNGSLFVELDADLARATITENSVSAYRSSVGAR